MSWKAPDGVEAFGRLDMGHVGARACVAMVLVGSLFQVVKGDPVEVGLEVSSEGIVVRKLVGVGR